MLDGVQRQSGGGDNLGVLDLSTLTKLPLKEKRLLPLAYSVIIPQRRPRTITRGFMRAYALALAGSQIDQMMFLSFLQGADDAVKVVVSRLVDRNASC
jgi:hypothetical protein